ncbi:MAG: aminodeoxychorismate synthase component I [Chloroflexi bacterium]|nr:aminodeoxychorismate synthase component I [Chloroflexota bacterium]MCI0819897.1 aminodeoxychorismate synthase component I [Chloroflexota bacterium]MCI0832124.1 aminodeoxychorismate synthase component I [Chloroflexota bacterium]MCI0842943.1 aminodeoxychorismate synthase component I [Chloroflexota bacterium]MCI0885824.1 aminodeoxychorismate synthase component I [Chloroflexota bacterium]
MTPTVRDLRTICAKPYGFWLDTALTGRAPDEASYCGAEPFLVLRSYGDTVELWTRGSTNRFTASPFAVLRDLLRQHRGRSGGAAGYLAYDLKRHVERLPETAIDELGLPECHLAFYERIDRFDPRPLSIETDSVPRHSPLDDTADPPPSNFTRDAYEAAVTRALDYIAAGDIYQVNLSQRFKVPLSGDTFDAYLCLRQDNPAPFAAFLRLPEADILSASPERFLRLDPLSRRIETRPIKGTRPRGRTPSEDAALAAELLASEKDRAENIMIVDLERNDLGRVAEVGSVRVTELAALETFPGVFHLTSQIVASLREDRDAVDLLLATFPGGSITGAPKIRAMEIIDELEPTARGVYTGAIGYFGFDGSLDLNIAIRTAVVRDGVAHFQAGGGIVADSVPALEYEETLHKASAIRRALTNSRPTGDRADAVAVPQR